MRSVILKDILLRKKKCWDKKIAATVEANLRPQTSEPTPQKIAPIGISVGIPV